MNASTPLPRDCADVLAVLRTRANRMHAVGEALASKNPPGHCDYINKADAAAACMATAKELEEARAAVAELIDIAWDAARRLEQIAGPDEDIVLAEAAALRAALARCGGAK